MSTYTIRQFEPGDVDDFLALYDEVLGSWKVDHEWFAWKYEENPYVDHSPIYVAEHEGTIVGARPFLALPMAVGGRPCLAFQPCDTMVHPDHRRRGLFTRMTERSVDRYRSAEPAFLFNFPNDLSLPGYSKLGWEPVEALARFYRIEDLEGYVAARHEAQGAQLAGSVAAPLVAGYNALRQATTSVPEGVTVERVRSDFASTLASIYRGAVPETVHAVRDETFLQWRERKPTWDYTAYVADDGDRRTGLLVGDPIGLKDDVAQRWLIDVVPVDRTGRTGHLQALIDRVLADSSDVDLLVAPPSTIPNSVLREHGFFRDDAPPFSYVSQPRTLVVRGFDDWTVNGIDLQGPDNWSISFAERDTC